ncbi:GON-4-like protein [Merluccius polli]|uniref:CASP8-associated protein 2 n=1 Tax=Merluccius polli TaxID=89951 RepID=A0AA47MA10_MERPO|nr:GON-4-like protein [Merluccius polli]
MRAGVSARITWTPRALAAAAAAAARADIPRGGGCSSGAAAAEDGCSSGAARTETTGLRWKMDSRRRVHGLAARTARNPYGVVTLSTCGRDIAARVDRSVSASAAATSPLRRRRILAPRPDVGGRRKRDVAGVPGRCRRWGSGLRSGELAVDGSDSRRPRSAEEARRRGEQRRRSGDDARHAGDGTRKRGIFSGVRTMDLRDKPALETFMVPQMSTMNPVRKHIKLGPHNALQQSPDPSHNALQQSPDPTEEEEESLLVEEDTTDSSLVITMEDGQGKVGGRTRWRKRKLTDMTGLSDSEEEVEPRLEIDRLLDQSLETKSRQHKLTAVNVKNILHEVITNEHVVAMMKAALNETEAVPPFEPKMTRSKLKEVVERGVVIPAWNMSPIKKVTEAKAPQFVDIPLAEEDSSDEEYRPDDDEEDETAEDTFQESDMESTASSPRGTRIQETARTKRQRARSVTMGPPPPPQAPPTRPVTDSSFLEKLHAVEEELSCMEPYQLLEDNMMAYRTRSKRPLRNVPLGRLEAELRAPDITPDMYDSGPAPEDREWTHWLRGLMSSDVENEEECDDEDDPEYNFLADNHEPDQEDYRDDRAVRITKKEVTELMEELFETLKEDLVSQDCDDEGHEEEEEQQEHTPLLVESQDRPITELRTVRQQLELMRRRRHTHNTHTRSTHAHNTHTHDTHTHAAEPLTLTMEPSQKTRLQQQLQQLLLQVHLLASFVPQLQSEAVITKHFLVELDVLAQRGEVMRGCGLGDSVFRVSNLCEALQMLEEEQRTPLVYEPRIRPPDAHGRMRCYPVLPAQLAWLFATRAVFLYPELLPCASLDPALYCHRKAASFTAAEDCLVVLGLRTMEGTTDPVQLVSRFLVRRSSARIRQRIHQCCRPAVVNNIIKVYRYQRVVGSMPAACSSRVEPAEQRPPVERDERLQPAWLSRSLPVIYSSLQTVTPSSSSLQTVTPSSSSLQTVTPSSSSLQTVTPSSSSLQTVTPSSSSLQTLIPAGVRRSRRCHRNLLSRTYSFPAGRVYPPLLPHNLAFQHMGFVLIQAPAAGTATGSPCGSPTGSPSGSPSSNPTGNPTGCPSGSPTGNHSGSPTGSPSGSPSGSPTGNPTGSPTEWGEGQDEGGALSQTESPSVWANNVSLTPSGDKLVLWTREVDRSILMACQQMGAKHKTFCLLADQLGNKTSNQVCDRFQQLMTLFHSAKQKSTSCSPAHCPISNQEAAHRPISNQEAAHRPISSQEAAHRPISSQEAAPD